MQPPANQNQGSNNPPANQPPAGNTSR